MLYNWYSYLLVDIPVIDKINLATEEKEKGNIAFRKNNFDEALLHYNKAIKLVPSEIVFYINRAGTISDIRNTIPVLLITIFD